MLTKIEEIEIKDDESSTIVWKMVRNSESYVDLSKVVFMMVEPILLANDDGTVVKRTKIRIVLDGDICFNTLFSDALMYKLTGDPKYMCCANEMPKDTKKDEEKHFVERHDEYIPQQSWIDYYWTKDENGNLMKGNS